MASQAINEEKFGALMGKALTDIGGAMSLLLAYMGDRLGLYQALERHGPGTSEEIAAEAGYDERYVREWLSGVAAAGHLEYDPGSQRFALSPEAALIYAAEGDPRCLQGFFQAVKSGFDDEEKSTEAFRAGRGLSWGDRSPCCFRGTDRFFRPGYAVNLVDQWIPSLTGIREKLQAGAKVADIGCGHGSSTILMAEAFPNSTFTGFDFHPPSIDAANEKRAEAGLANVGFEVASAKTFPGTDYDFICIFDAIHDMGDPEAACRHIRSALEPDGTLLIVDPLAGDRLEENLTPLGRAYYAASTLNCVPTSLSQPGGLALGAQAGEVRLREVATRAGFSRFRRAVEAPFNLVIEARP